LKNIPGCQAGTDRLAGLPPKFIAQFLADGFALFSKLVFMVAGRDLHGVDYSASEYSESATPSLQLLYNLSKDTPRRSRTGENLH
jgi:hypothetical protein